MQLREQIFGLLEFTSPREFLDDGVVGIVVMGKPRVVFACVVEYLEGEVEVLLSSDHRYEAFGVEALGPGFDWRCDGVGFEKSGIDVVHGSCGGGEGTEGGGLV